MNKKEFIKLLELKLSILDEEELKDIINEYKDTIDEKVKHGKTEEEAVADFGSIDELTKEILKAYKINPKYGEKKDNVKEVIDDCESLIKRGARKLADFSKNVASDFKNSNNNLTIELIFEILIKAIILLVLFALLRLPFEFITYLGRGILDIAFYPLDEILIFIWRVIIFLLYFVCCVLLSLAMFRQYFNNSKVEEKNTKNKSKKKEPEMKKNKEEKKSEMVSDDKEQKDVEYDNIEEKIENKNEKIVVKETASSVISKVLKVILQVFIVLCCLVPLWFISFGISIVLILSIYYLFIGINTIGILIGSIGALILFGYASSIFHSIAFNRKKVYFAPFIVSIIFMVVGSLLTFDMVARIDYIREVPKNDFNLTTDKFEFEILKPTTIQGINNIEYVIDNSIKDNKMTIEIAYYNELQYIEYVKNHPSDLEQEYINIYSYNSNLNHGGWKMYNLIVDNIKDNKFYEYDLLYEQEAKVYANEETMKLIKKD